MSGRPKRYIIASDESKFVGRIFDLSIVALSFDSYAEAAKHSDAKYALDVNERTSLLTRRVESLNHIGDLLWPKEPLHTNLPPVSAYEYCNLVHDAFLMRIISVLDCCCLLLVEVLELDLPPRRTNVANIQKLAPDNPCCRELESLSSLQNELRAERNARFHRAEEEAFTDDDETFKTVALFSHWGTSMVGNDRHGRKINLDRYFRAAIGRLRSKFNSNAKVLVNALDTFYLPLNNEFEERFRIKCRQEDSFMQKSKQAR
jgi:hypothetical protein